MRARQRQLQPLPLPQLQLNRMSEFHQQTVNRAARNPLTTFLSIPFGKTVPPDDDLFPLIRPPVDVNAPQADGVEEGEDAATDADADAAMGDGSEASEESDEVSSSVHK